jgi:zinc protease
MSNSSSSEKKVYKKVLANGLTVLVRPNHIIPKVSTQLWYNVGSKDEKTSEKGIAHLIEHMIFKGTKTLSESDINMITQKLSGYCNAFTSYDYTGYLFDFPTHHWHEALPIMADCMTNCLFDADMLASEMKAVIQELKMYRDDYTSSLAQEMITAIFVDHPYHYPIIGFKQDLWGLKREALVNFYKKHYVPNNATLVVVGDVTPDEVFNLAEKNFGTIPADLDYKKDSFYFSPDIVSKSVTLYRDVQQPTIMLSWVVPGAREKLDYFFDVLAWVLGLGKGSRLYRLLVDELQLATDVEAFNYDLFDYSPFFIYIQPKRVEDIGKIIDLVNREISSIVEKGLTGEELKRATKQAEAQYLATLEYNQKQAYVIGQSYLATGDENFLFHYLDHSLDEVKTKIHTLLKTNFRPSLMQNGFVLPLAESDKDYWKFVQEQSDKEDEKILSRIKREAPLQDGAHVHTIKVAKPKDFTFPRAHKHMLSNGIKVLSYHNANVPKIELILALPAKHYYDPEKLQGLSVFMCNMMVEGTKNYTAAELADAIESRGMSLDIVPGQIVMSMMSNDLPIALELLVEVLTRATFEKKSIEKVREQLISDLKDYWDTPASFVAQLARDQVYKHHPYSKKVLGDFESLQAIGRDDIVTYYQKFISPYHSIISIVGDIEQYDLITLLEKTLGLWQGPEVKPIEFPKLVPVKAHDVNYPINRDQVVLGYAGLSISRFNKDFDKVLLFDQIFTGGSSGSMASRLFQLREQSGLFYTIGGSLLAYADEQPGMMFIKTIVSLDRLAEAEKALQETIAHAGDYIHDYELQEAKDSVVNALVDNFASNRNIAGTFLFLERFGFPEDFFDHRAGQLFEISAPSIQNVVQALLKTDNLVKIRIGRV